MNLNLRPVKVLYGDLPSNAEPILNSIPYVDEGDNLVFDKADLHVISLDEVDCMKPLERELYDAMCDGFRDNPDADQIVLQPK